MFVSMAGKKIDLGDPTLGKQLLQNPRGPLPTEVFEAYVLQGGPYAPATYSPPVGFPRRKAALDWLPRVSRIGPAIPAKRAVDDALLEVGGVLGWLAPCVGEDHPSQN